MQEMASKLIFVALAVTLLHVSRGSTKTTKRGVFGYGYGVPFNGYNAYDQYPNQLLSLQPGQQLSPLVLGKPPVVNPIYNSPPGNPQPNLPLLNPSTVTPAEIASAIQDAKEASSSVFAAQKRVQDAKNSVLHEQHLAREKEAQATLALQRTEAAAAIQRQEAKAAATAVVQAQQRLAHAKAEVAEKQRIAAAKEAQAAAIIQKSAAVAAAHIQKSDHAAQKISAIHNSESSALKNVAISRDASLSAASAALQASADSENGGRIHFLAHGNFPPAVQYGSW